MLVVAMFEVVIHLFYMEAFKKVAVENVPYKHSLYKLYVDDTFLIWAHGMEKLHDFVPFLNGLHENIKFTMELEQWELFGDIMIVRKQDGILGCNMYRQPTNTNLYLNNLSSSSCSKKVYNIQTSG